MARARLGLGADRAAPCSERGLGFGSGYILGLYRDNGKENGNYCLGFRVYGSGSGVRGLGLKV